MHFIDLRCELTAVAGDFCTPAVMEAREVAVVIVVDDSGVAIDGLS